MRRSLNLALLLLTACRGGAKLPETIPVTGEHAMVVTSHQLASDVGVDVLRRGGNAVDAAVAVAFALAVVHPVAGNIGGGGVMVIRMHDDSAHALDYRETAPTRATRDMYVDTAGNQIGSSLTG